MNERMVESENVLLLEPIGPDRGIPVLPAVDPIGEPGGARGLVVAQVLTAPRDGLGALVDALAPALARYRSADGREAGVLSTLELPNNFPRLPVRTDGPHLVWLGIVADDDALEAVRSAADALAASARAAGLVRGEPELLVLEPTFRSRLRRR